MPISIITLKIVTEQKWKIGLSGCQTIDASFYAKCNRWVGDYRNNLQHAEIYSEIIAYRC